MAARLITQNASDAELRKFRQKNATSSEAPAAPIDEYSENNIKFHQEIIALGKNEFLITTARRLFNHMHAIRSSTIKHPQRTLASVIDHMRIVEALCERNTDEAEALVRDHALKLAAHVEQHVDYLD